MRKSQALRKPHRIRRKKSIFKNRYFWIFVLGLIGISVVLHFLVFGKIFQIKEIRISGNQKVLTEDIQNVVRSQIERKVLFFSSKSIFLVNKAEIKRLILKEFSLIGEVDLKRKLPNLLEIEVKEREPVAIFFHSPENYFFIDKAGVIFEKVSEILPEVLKIKSSIVKEKPKLGEQLISKENLSRILEIEFKLKENLEILLTEAFLISEERLNAKTSEGWEIYLNPTEDLDWQLQKLSLVLEQKIPPEKREKLEYIDLRFGDRAYFKYRD